MTEKRKRLRRTAVSAAVAGTVYLYTIMPRLLHKPDKQAFETHFFAPRGLHRNGTANSISR